MKKKIFFPSEKEEWKKFEKNNVTIAFNAKKEKKYILLMFQNITQIVKNKLLSCSKKLLALLRRVTSKHHGDFYYLNCLHSLRTKSKLELDKKVWKNKDFFNISMPSEDTKILEFNQYQKPDKATFVIYADLQCLIEKLMDVKIILKIHLHQQ